MIALATAAYLAALCGCEPKWQPAAYGPELSFDSRWMVLGATNTGKDFWVACALELAARVIVYDPAEDPKWPAVGFRATTVARLAIEVESGALKLTAPSLRVVCVPRPSDFRRKETGRHDKAEEQAEELAALLSMCRAAGNMVVVVGEVGQLPSTCAPALAELAMKDRHRGIAAIYISQRATGIPLNVRSQASQIVSFLQHDADDRDGLRRQCGDDFEAQAAAWTPGAPPAIWRPASRQGKKG